MPGRPPRVRMPRSGRECASLRGCVQTGSEAACRRVLELSTLSGCILIDESSLAVTRDRKQAILDFLRSL